MAKVRGALNSSRLPLRCHSSVREFIGSIRENPFDQARWLVFADWLMDSGYQFYADRIRLKVASGTAYDRMVRRLEEVMAGQEYIKFHFRNIHQKSQLAYHAAAETALNGLGLTDWMLYERAYVARYEYAGPAYILPAPIYPPLRIGYSTDVTRNFANVVYAIGLSAYPGGHWPFYFYLYPWEWPNLTMTGGGRVTMAAGLKMRP